MGELITDCNSAMASKHDAITGLCLIILIANCKVDLMGVLLIPGYSLVHLKS